nr:hypothetical protein [uncultured Vibrio sp.]
MNIEKDSTIIDRGNQVGEHSYILFSCNNSHYTLSGKVKFAFMGISLH